MAPRPDQRQIGIKTSGSYPKITVVRLFGGLAPCLVDFLAPLFANANGASFFNGCLGIFAANGFGDLFRDSYLGGAAGCESRIGPDGIVLFSIRAENPPSTGFPAAPLGRRARRC
jgi:hypothetical protein